MVDAEAEAHGVMKASDFARVYVRILERPEIAGCRVRVEGFGDLDEVRFEDLLVLSRDMERRAREMGSEGLRERAAGGSRSSTVA